MAVTDASRRFVLGRETIQRTTTSADLAAITACCREDAIRVIVVGLPLNVDGTEGGQAKSARAFAAELHVASNLPVLMVDERYTSLEAEELLSERFSDWRDRRDRVDRAAATLILKTFLEHGPYREGKAPS